MLLGKLATKKAARDRILRERLTEPVHMNIASLFVAALGSFRARVAWDVVIRPQYAYGLLAAADQAKEAGIGTITAVEFGVAAGEGLLNLCKLAAPVSRTTGVQINVVGFDLGTGLPPPTDYRDHPEEFQSGDYPMDYKRLAERLPSNCRLILGPIGETVPYYRQRSLSPQAPLGFAAIDVDYYSSARQALDLLTDPEAAKYLFLPILYFDDIELPNYSDWTGELLAINEFNAENEKRKIQQYRFLRSLRLFKNASWIDHIYLLHLFDYPQSKLVRARRNRQNLYL